VLLKQKFSLYVNSTVQKIVGVEMKEVKFKYSELLRKLDDTEYCNVVRPNQITDINISLKSYRTICITLHIGFRHFPFISLNVMVQLSLCVIKFYIMKTYGE
jgi:hypothetical protein